MRIIIVLAVILLFSCNHNSKVKMEGQLIKTEEYLSTKTINSRDRELFFRVVSNPYQWNKDVYMILYLNNKVVYSGSFKLSGIMQTEQVNPDKLVHFRMEIIQDEKLYIYEDKSNFNWSDEYKYIYIGLFPDNPTTDNIHFFPQKTEVIQ